MYAKTATYFIQAYCVVNFVNPTRMESVVADGILMHVFDYSSYGTHKYINSDDLTIQLGMTPGAGVYGYYLFPDGSFLLKTCPGPVAFWSGKGEDKPEFCKPIRKEKI